MTDADDSVDWRQLREFADVDLTKSFVLSWHVEGETLLVDVDLLLTSKHPFYEKPRPAERVCIRPAVIEFPFCNAIQFAGSGADESLLTVIAGIGTGVIQGLRRVRDGLFEIDGDFGTVRVDSERPFLRLNKQ